MTAFMPPLRASQVTIVGLGDSTTAGTPGFRSPVEAPPEGSGNPESQYAYWVQKSHPEWKILNRGINRERTDEILKRFERDVLGHSPALVIVLAGVNDLYQGESVDSILKNLKEIYDKADQAGIKILACTVLPYNNGLTKEFHERMLQVNDGIRTLSEKQGYGFCDTYHVLEDPTKPGRLISTSDGYHPDAEGVPQNGLGDWRSP